MDEQWGATGVVIAFLLLVVGTYSLFNLPGVFWFATIDCPPQSDCLSSFWPFVYSILTIVAAFAILLGIGVVHLFGAVWEWGTD